MLFEVIVALAFRICNFAMQLFTLLLQITPPMEGNWTGWDHSQLALKPPGRNP